MPKGHSHITFKYLDPKISRKVCHFLNNHIIVLSPLEAYLIVNPSLNNRTIDISPAKGAEIEAIHYIKGYRYVKPHSGANSIKIGKIEYNIYREPQGD